jgi:hypothetical protein
LCSNNPWSRNKKKREPLQVLGVFVTVSHFCKQFSPQNHHLLVFLKFYSSLEKKNLKKKSFCTQHRNGDFINIILYFDHYPREQLLGSNPSTGNLPKTFRRTSSSFRKGRNLGEWE